ncbi:hypothetical protein Sru01_30920 [Sphaerisporangium rufum]|uniref:Aminoglycoside phosphotransferase domain-containing protein n=1 Tax=Sphaerisporangium rufum TaxID=1381558 RepID=A0A919R6I1_9ACTN|nr:aminoglycoside phosphotransferase family protein [Sphaerisporangium rufum]GII78110.1 hypothetical protein Sru01_30920 [Sphaerisporangium rufum]
MPRTHWEDLPGAVRETVQDRTGTVLKAESATEGLMPGMAGTLHLAGGDRLFFKAVNADSPAVRLYERERWAGGVLPSPVPAPRLRWSAEVHGWICLVFDHIDGREADLSPGSPDVPLVLDAVARLGEQLSPSPDANAPHVAEHVSLLRAKAAHLLAKPAFDDRAIYEAALARFEPSSLDGDTLLHYDLHAGNLRMVHDRPWIVDWGFACRGAAWVEPVMLAPRLVAAGHSPAEAEDLLAAVPAWRAAPAAGVTGLAALWTLFRVYKARFGPAEAREFRARAARAGLAWVAYRVGSGS